MLEPGRNAGLVAAAVFAAGFLAAGSVRGDDLTTLSGQTFHQVQPLRAEPDGVTWRHAGGVVKVEFSDSPENVRAAYHYDAAKAAAYHEAQATARRQADEQARQLLQTHDERLRARAQGQARAAAADAGSPAATSPALVYRHGLAPTVQAAARLLQDQKAEDDARAATNARNSEGLGNPAIWRLVPGVGKAPVAPRMDVPNSEEFKTSIALPSAAVQTLGASQGPAGAFGDSSAQNSFFTPLYMTKSYNEDLDRAAAFARDAPLK